MLGRQLLQAFEEPVLRGHAAHVTRHGLHDDASNVATLCPKDTGQGVEIIECEGYRVARIVDGDTGACRDAECRGAAARFDQEAVGVAVVAASELDDLVPSRRAPGKADGAHGRLRAGVDHADHLDGWHRFDDHVSQRDFEVRRGTVARASLHGVLEGGYNARVGVAYDHRAPACDVVDVGVAVGVEDAAALGPGDKAGLAPDGLEGPNGAVHSTRDQFPGLGEKPSGGFGRQAHRGILRDTCL